MYKLVRSPLKAMFHVKRRKMGNTSLHLRLHIVNRSEIRVYGQVKKLPGEHGCGFHIKPDPSYTNVQSAVDKRFALWR